MLKENIVNALSTQINNEYHSAYLYHEMAAYCDRLGFKGFSNWLHVQAQEELAHGIHMYQHILDRSEQPQFFDIKSPPTNFDGLIDVFTKVLEHEQFVTREINKIATLAMKEGDHATYVFITWFINEQVEEESSADLILQKLKFIGDNTGMLYNLDLEMGTRVFVNPFPVA